jgi:hypothetical protein
MSPSGMSPRITIREAAAACRRKASAPKRRGLRKREDLIIPVLRSGGRFIENEILLRGDCLYNELFVRVQEPR